MPTRANSVDDEYQETASDAFTRLSIATCPSDDGTRPINPSWAGCEIGYQSPAFEFHPTYPLVVNEETTIRVLVRNFGTMDATTVFFECAYNIYIGNEHQGMVPIVNQTIPVVPSGGETTVEVNWTPADLYAVHACIHARVFDVYSLVQYPYRTSSWDETINPQAGHRNVRLIQIQHANRPVALPFLARNFRSEAINTRMLVTKIDARQRFRSLEERFPLPFIMELVTEGSVRAVNLSARSEALPHTDRIRPAPPVLGPIWRDRTGLRLEGNSGTMLWPRAEVAERFRHQRFGFATTDILAGIADNGYEARFITNGEFRNAAVESYLPMELGADSTREVCVIIPPEALPPRGRRAVYQVDYQVGNGHPVQHVIYLVH